MTTIDFINKAIEVHGEKYNYYKTEYIKTSENIIITCPVHGNFNQKPSNHLSGSGCIKCGYTSMKSKQKKGKDKFISESIKIHGKCYDYTNVIYKNNKTKVKILCKKCNNIFEQLPHNHLKGCNCPYCTGRLFDIDKFIKKANKKHGGKYDYSKVIYENNKKKIIITCPVHGDFKQRTSHHLICGCPKCSNKHKYSTEEFIEKASDIHDYKYDYSKSNYINAKNKITIICNTHGKFQQSASSHLSGRGCPNCMESKGEREIAKILKNKKIKFIRQKTFNDCKLERNLYYDFFLPEKNICIEYDGKQHFESVDIWGGEENLEKVKKRDIKKNEYCAKNNIKLIRIKYDQNIYESLYNSM